MVTTQPGMARQSVERERLGQVVADIGAGVDEVDGIVVVFLDAGGDGEDVRVDFYS